MLQTLIEFFSLTDPNVRAVVLGTSLLTTSSALVGSFALLKQKALVGDAVSHAVLPGVCLSFILTGSKHPLYLVVGAFITGWLSLLLIDQIIHRSKIKEDTAIALVLSVSFGLGLLLLTTIQHNGNAAQSGLSNFLFGKAAALISDDLASLALLSIVLIITVLLFFKEFTLLAFDKAFAQASGLPVQALELLLSSLTVLAIVIGIRAVGILLMASMLITPPAAARFWTQSLPKMVLLATLLGMIAGLAGTYISYVAPFMPTGPWIVMAISFIAYISFLLAPQQGFLARKMRQRRHQQKTLKENILKIFYALGEKDSDFYRNRTIVALQEHRHIPFKKLHQGLKDLQWQKMVQETEESWSLTPAGQKRGEEVSRLHELWELYLKKYLKLQPDHVHEDAESIEHIITPELAQELKQLLTDS